MRIGVFGDSFSGSNGPTSWVTLLGDKNNTVRNLSYPGTSLFHAFRLLPGNLKNFDVIIFTVTAPGRLFTTIPADRLSLCNSFAVDHLLNLDEMKKSPYYNHVVAADKYYKYLQNNEFDDFVHLSIVNKIIDLVKQANKKLILLPSMLSSKLNNLIEFEYFDEKFSLSDINELERNFYKLPHTAMHYEKKERLQNHLADENNLILNNLIKKIIQGEHIKVNIKMFDSNPTTDVNVYYNMEEIEKL
jgi:hypothetical protein